MEVSPTDQLKHCCPSHTPANGKGCTFRVCRSQVMAIASMLGMTDCLAVCKYPPTRTRPILGLTLPRLLQRG